MVIKNIGQVIVKFIIEHDQYLTALFSLANVDTGMGFIVVAGSVRCRNEDFCMNVTVF